MRRSVSATGLTAALLVGLATGCGGSSGDSGSSGAHGPAAAAAAAACGPVLRTPAPATSTEITRAVGDRLTGAGLLGQAAAASDPGRYGDLAAASEAVSGAVERLDLASLRTSLARMASACRSDAQSGGSAPNTGSSDARDACAALAQPPKKLSGDQPAPLATDENLLGAATLGQAAAEADHAYANLTAPLQRLIVAVDGAAPVQTPLHAAQQACGGDDLAH